jgi:metal-dependent hydrolase (beta-lactamase superfamily II)
VIWSIDFRTVEALGLSHGHFDHWGTFLEILKSKKEEFRKGIPLYIGEEGFVERFGQLPGGVLSLGQLKRENVERLGFVNTLTGAKPELIQRTVADIKAVNPDYIVPTHCTGYEAITVFEREMPGQFILNIAGTRYLFTV